MFETGVKMVADTGKALERIIAQVSEINRVVAEIASGVEEQASGLQQVNIAMNQMDQSTQQNAMMVEQATAANRSLSQETTLLAELVGKFQFGGASGAGQGREAQKAAPRAVVRSAA